MKYCPSCGKQMRFISQYNQWFCDSCRDYPLSVNNNRNYGQSCIAKNSVLNMLLLISGTLMFLSVSLFFIGILFLNSGLYYLNVNYDYAWTSPYRDIYRGIWNIVFAFVIFIALKIYLNSTVQKVNWWKKLQNEMADGCYGVLASNSMKKSVTSLYGIVYGGLVIMGIISLGIGIFMVNLETNLFIESGFEIIIGIIVIFIGYQLYVQEIENVSTKIFPIISEQTKKKEELKVETPEEDKDTIC